MQNICKNVLELSTSRGYAVDVKCCKMYYFICSLTTSKTFLQMICKCFILRVTTFLEVVTREIKH